jgi:cytochrome c-type biogenesis protein CcmH
VKSEKGRMKIRNFIPLAFFLLVFTFAVFPLASVAAQKSTPSVDEVNAIARQMFCPICENTPLDICPTEACRDWRELIRQMLAQGKTPTEIKQYFVDHYGTRVLSEPPQKGFNILLYITPGVVIVIGILFLFLGVFLTWILPSRKPSTGVATNSEPAREDKYASRLEEELRKRS